MTKSNRMRTYVAELVRQMSPELTLQLAELERAGRLDDVLDRVFTRYMATRAAAGYASTLLRGELDLLMPDVTGPLRSVARSQHSVIEQGAADVVRVTTQQRPAVAA
jgi:hypothetical protein